MSLSGFNHMTPTDDGTINTPKSTHKPLIHLEEIKSERVHWKKITDFALNFVLEETHTT